MNDNQERVRKIYDMLFEMATGNFKYRLRISKKNDHLDKVIEILNHVAEQINDSLLAIGNDAPKYIFKVALQPLLIVENDIKIKSFRAQLPKQLGYENSEFIKLDFNKIITVESELLFNKIKNTFTDEEKGYKKVKLVFLGKSGQNLHYFCTLARHLPGDLVVISSISNRIEGIIHNYVISKTDSDLLKIQLVYNFILGKLQEPLPSTKELSEMFGLNEVQIKSDFRKLFHTSIYKLYTDERLKLAYELIVCTEDSLSSIATQSGFSNYITFYKAFKKKYACAPTEVERNGNLF